MSNTHPITTASSSSNFQLIFNNALKAYEKRTKKDLLAHPLAAELQNCNSPRNILDVLHQQVQGLDRSMSSDDRWTKWLDPTVNVLYMLSETLGKGISLVFSPGKVIFAAVGVLLSAAKNTRKSHETLIEIFGRIENTIIQIMVEVLTILGIATKEMKQGRIKKYGKRLIGKNTMEDALKKLDKLTQEEARMTIAENLRATHAVDERVRGDTERVLDRVGNVNDKVTEVICVERSSSPNLIILTIGLIHLSENQLRDKIHKWLAPPDPSITITSRVLLITKNCNVVLRRKHLQGMEIKRFPLVDSRKAPMRRRSSIDGYFYFDFRNANKQSLRDLLPSLLTQLSARSSPRCDILSELYSVHDNGKNQPSDIVLTKCLQDMLSLPDQSPIYLIMDALDESPVTSEIPPARERVLQLLKELVDLGLPNLHICITSRPEIDIRNAIEPLTSLRVSLHDETGQKEDIADYVRSIVYSNSDTNMRRWKKDDKEIVVKTLLNELTDVPWTFCQLVVLRDCLPSSVRHFLENYQNHWTRQAESRSRPTSIAMPCCGDPPLRVEELAEVLAIDFNDAEGVPKLNPSWRWEDQERALLTSCSSLIAIVDTVFPSEYLTSERLATSSQDVSRYHITFETAHTILAQACVSVLLQLDDHDERDDVEKKAPLAVYAAEYWVRHAQFEDVVSRIKGMEDLFDVDKPYFVAWRELYDIDINLPGSVFFFGHGDAVQTYPSKHPQHVNTIGGCYRTPAVAALAGRHFEVAQVLHRNKSSVEPKGYLENTPLHSAAYYGDLEMVQTMLPQMVIAMTLESLDC
ncbi:hypothetical protein BGY98DRAFT_1103165 [Russula aff. rugulosa BPL654]|nr:hypothetical protein BGY98DRAFT_1103165 [Russula aff. rugulosa BPL654]